MYYEDGPCGGYGYEEPYYCDLAGCLCYGGDCKTCEQQMRADLSPYEDDAERLPYDPYAWMY